MTWQKTLIFFLGSDENPNLFAPGCIKQKFKSSDDVRMTWQFENLKGSLRKFI